MRRTMPKASSMPELTAIREGGCTYADACLRVGIAKSTFQRWKVKGQEQARGQFSAFCAHLKKAESDYRAYYLKKIQDAANESSVETKKTVRTDGDGETTFQEVVELKRAPSWTAAAWLLERKFPEEYSRKHLEVKATVTTTEPREPMQLVIVDPVKLADAEAAVPTGKTPAEEPPATE